MWLIACVISIYSTVKWQRWWWRWRRQWQQYVRSKMLTITSGVCLYADAYEVTINARECDEKWKCLCCANIHPSATSRRKYEVQQEDEWKWMSTFCFFRVIYSIKMKQWSRCMHTMVNPYLLRGLRFLFANFLHNYVYLSFCVWICDLLIYYIMMNCNVDSFRHIQ